MDTPINQRIHAALDGDSSQDDLSPAERAELTQVNDLFANVLRTVATSEIPSQAPAVLARINADRAVTVTHRAPLASRLFGWFWAPARVSISLRPAYALAFAGAFAAIAFIGMPERGASNGRPPIAATASQAVLVQFRFDAPRASEVSLAGDFTNWAPTYSLQRSGTGTWTVVVPLSPGVHDYSFIVDGNRWTPDPTAPARADGFGGMNSRIAVLASDGVKSL